MCQSFPCPPHCEIDRAQEDDLDAIMEIERLSFGNPWPRRAFSDELQREVGRLEVLRVRPGITWPTMGFEAPGWQGARRAHTRRYATDEQRSQSGWIGGQNGQVAPGRILGQEVQGEKRVVGFINYWLLIHEVHVLNVAVHPDARRCGLGTWLMEHVMARARELGAQEVTLEVRPSNQAAQGLYQRLGFTTTGVRPGYYENREDAIIMVRKVD